MQTVQSKNGYAMTAAACLWLGLFPLLQGGTYAHITYDKWIIMMILTGITFICFLLDRVRGLIIRRIASGLPAGPGPFRGVILPLCLAAAMILWTVLSCLLSTCGPETWWLGESVRYEGLLTKLFYFVIFLFFLFSRVRLKPVLFSAAAGVAVFFVIVMLQRAPGNPLGLYPGGRNYLNSKVFQGTIGNVDMDTGYLLLMAGLFLHGLIGSIPPLLETVKSRRNKPAAEGQPGAEPGKRPAGKLFSRILLPAVLLTALAVDLYLIVTMEVQFGIIGLAVLFLFTFLWFLPRKWRLPVLIFLIILALLVVWFWPKHGGGIWELHEIFHGRGRLSFGSNRVAVWVYSLRLARENLLFGGGTGTFRIRFNEFLAQNGLVIPTEQDGVALPDYFDNPHNEYILQLTDQGLPAALLFLLLPLYAVFRRRDGWFPRLAPCSAAVLCYAVQALLSFSVCLVAPMFWVVLGLSFRE